MKKKIKRNRTIRRGIDYVKLRKIWKILEIARDKNTWLYVAQISKVTNIHESTIRYYLNKYLNRAIEKNPSIPPGIKLRQIRLKPGILLENYINALEHIENRKKSLKKT
ncbi:MAG: hypothetical protein J7K26_00160 [Candidatus Aenigmarchaeota archaeon]|nr:hypothetical protein [Candidatus Aenigmarchaeota archaeon]